MKSSKRPNVVFVLTDDQGYPPLGCHGHPFIQTPNLDTFYEDSVHFHQFHTGTTCAPTRAGLMTGHYCNSTGVWHTIGGRSLLRKDEWSLATALRDAGYRTAMFGKWHLGDEYPYRPQDRGFETVICHGGGGISQQPDYWGNDYFDDTYLVNGTPTKFKGYCTDVFFQEAIRYIESVKDQPFFCYISTNAPHGPFNVENRYADLYRDKTASEKYARFLGMITNIDENFGRLRQRLRELGLEENTILIFMSDNGQTGVGQEVDNLYNAGMRGLKGSPYDGGHRVPFFIRWPNGKITGGRTIRELTAYIDFMPTILDLCDIPVPPERSFHGRSLVPLLYGEESSEWSKRVITTDTQRVAHPIKWRLSCVMKDCWRLVNRYELYNIEQDPAQERDVSAEHPELVAELQREYEKWWDLCTENVEEEVPLSIGAQLNVETVLRTHDLRNEEEHAVVWNQSQVRQGVICHGWWEVYAEQDGLYQFDLRRWPKEAGHRVTAGIDGDDIEWRKDGFVAPGSENLYTGGKAMPVDMASITLSGLPTQYTEVTPDATGAVFQLHLKRGHYHLRAQFSNAQRFYCSAYYVYAKRIG